MVKLGILFMMFLESDDMQNYKKDELCQNIGTTGVR